MAKQRPVNTSSTETRTYDKDLNKDIKDYHLPPNSWTHARNAINNSNSGDIGDIGNEPSNLACGQAPYTIIGTIHLEADRWAIFSTNGTSSEIGLYVEGECNYSRIVNADCLNFSKAHLIIGVSRELFDCTFQLYWDDGLNPSRSMNITNVPWIQDCQIVNDCNICTDTTDLDCDKILLAPLITTPCFTVQQGASGGSLFNGSYYVVAAYTVNQQKIGDYSVPSNIQALFTHRNVGGSLDIIVDQMDQDFEEFELVIVSVINQQTSARRVGIYSTRQNRISIDLIDNSWPSVDIGLIPLRTPIVDKSDAMYDIGKYLLRVGPTDKFDFNYQPLANQISTKWVAVQYPANYYRKGGNVTSYMRDEVYPFFIRFRYNTGDVTASFHIPGRAANATDFDILATADAAIEINDGIPAYRWRVQNTATAAPAAGTLPDGGQIIAEGDMGYWESSELYDDDKPEIWNANLPGFPQFDLCGKPIRHHRFPDNATDASGNKLTNHFAPGGNAIRLMGVQFSNIQPPVDNNNVVIPGIVGYEILRGSREGNKTVVAKGIINNMYEYDIQGGITNRQGLYPNYPYNDLGRRGGVVVGDPFISTQQTGFNSIGCDVTPSPIPNYYNKIYSRNHFTFHSPDTQFRNPFLSAKELKIYGEFTGTAEGGFIPVDKHPKHKAVTDLSFVVALIAGIGYGMIARNGQRTTTLTGPRYTNLGGSGIFAGPAGSGNWAQPGFAGLPTAAVVGNPAVNGIYGATNATETAWYGVGGAALLGALSPAGLTNNGYYTALNTTFNPSGLTTGAIGKERQYTQQMGPAYETHPVLRALQALPTFSYYFGEGFETTLRVIKALSPYREYALQYQSHCLYSQLLSPQVDNNRRSIEEAIYLEPQLQDMGTSFRINNVYRGRAVALQTDSNPLRPVADPVTEDNTRQTVGTASSAGLGPTHADPQVPFNTTSSCHYTALKQRIQNQYGQIENITQVPVSKCVAEIGNGTSEIIFGGDIYIGRFTEKNTLHYFYDWLFDQPDGSVMNYDQKKMIPNPVYWMDTDEFDLNEFTNSVLTNILNPASWVFPSDKQVLDRANCSTGLFVIKEAFFYLFNSGVRDFFVESEVNVDLRDWEDDDSERHYDPYGFTDLRSLFYPSVIKSGNFFKYDYSLSISRLFNNFISWGNTHKRNYDPTVAEQCYKYRQNRVLYSLPQQEENEKDYYRIFLPNNYKDFLSRLVAVKTINKSGAMFLFENESPIQFVGVDQFETDAGTKITIGDGGLFNQPQQNLLNSDRPYEYGSCQNRLSVLNTPVGIVWMSQNQGKIFLVQNGIGEISMQDMNWWFARYLPYQLLKQFPNFELTDNPVIGISCQSIYDNENKIIYFCKRDFVLRSDLVDTVTYVNEDNFLVNGILQIKLGDPRYFQDASWTISYDPKTKGWLSYHDWHPNLLMPGKKTFMSILDNGIWVHNTRCDSYCNFYGVDYPFEVEYTINTGQNVNVLRNVWYQMMAFRYADNCYDRYHVLDFNFDDAVVHNSEQCSGILRLNLQPKNDAFGILDYPIIGATFIDILYSKEEQKYRFNQFWDITDDRGEFSTAQRMIWNTEPNGYIRNLNPINLNYSKNQFERKKFRHVENKVLLRRRVSGQYKMILILTNNNNLNSPR